MFGMGFAEILIVAVIAIIFLGPDKLPEAMVNVAKMFKKVKTTINDAKDSIENELHLDEIKSEADKYKRSIENTKTELTETLDTPSREVKDLFADLKDDKKTEEKKSENS